MRILGQPYQRSDRGGWWLRYTDPTTGRRRKESFRTRNLAELRRAILIQQINTDVYTGCVSVPLAVAHAEYLQKYDLLGLTEAAKYEADVALRMFSEWTGNIMTGELNQAYFDLFVLYRQKSAATWTVNKTIGRLAAFVNWARDPARRYITSPIRLTQIKAPIIPVKALTDDQIRSLIRRAPTEIWRIRLLISLTTGLRKNDTDSLQIADIDLAGPTVRTVAIKTGKPLIAPLPDKLTGPLTEYIRSLPAGQIKLFADRNIRKIWDSFREGITRQDLRKTFATLMQRIGSISTARDLLQHSSSRTTDQFYSDKELIDRWKVNQLPLEKWI